ncbi:protein DENND6B [Bactrocera neohumeralis]|uniref:protein DENND6B n=1 Tax=Bactrocera tryoni TaxID=59916 RepID=UPI001A99221C|nr:protein DENND6B [Bactrocera tryoni]XP_050331394.1 protein DENND6B [Bactrocera neohumeralis]
MTEKSISTNNLTDNNDCLRVTSEINTCNDINHWANFSQWIHCMCVITFDLNIGQALEFVYPPQFVPSETETANICYMAFPDSNSGCMGDTKFHMRLRRIHKESHNGNLKKIFHSYNSDCISALRVDESHYWGFVYFRQKRDANLPRGYFQKSFILVTHLPFCNLFYNIVDQLAPRYFENGNSNIEEACDQINRLWPPLQAGVSLDLQLFDNIYQINIPTISGKKCGTVGQKTDTIRKTSLNAFSTKILNSVNELELYQCLCFTLENLYTLWELVLIAEPIVIVGTSPADCSHMVHSLVSLIAPIEYCAEARPYFTIHDSEFKEFTREYGNTPPPVILGVTNPFFIKLLKDWPHILRLVDNQINMQQHQQLQKNIRNSDSVTSFNSSSTGNIKKGLPNASSSLVLNTSATISDGALPGLYTKYKPFLKKDKNLIKKVKAGVKTKRPDHVQTALLRRNLLELTQSFMIPLERYIASLMPLQKDISPFKSAPNANAFKLEDFLATIEHSGPHLTSPLKGDWKGLYRRFFNSPNFRGWYNSRHRELQLTLQDLQLQALSVANLEKWAHDKQEVEIIDMILKLKQKMNLYTDTTNNSATQDLIRAQINCMKDLLPNDLKNVVNI